MNPGSDQAIKKGCICPAAENEHGIGCYMKANGEPSFLIRNDCPLHGKDILKDRRDYERDH